MDWGDVVKIVVPSLLSFWIGRVHANHGSKTARKKETKQKLVLLARAIAKDAIAYHCTVEDGQSREKSSALLKNQLHQLRTDIKDYAPLCDVEKKSWMQHNTAIFDAVTGYPFEPQEMPAQIDRSRERSITDSSERLVRLINGS